MESNKRYNDPSRKDCVRKKTPLWKKQSKKRMRHGKYCGQRQQGILPQTKTKRKSKLNF